MSSDWPLVEREKEFRIIEAALRGETNACGVVLTGDSGVGKTTLARHVTAALDGGVRWVAGTESARSIPLGVFAHLVGPATSSDPVTYLAAARESLLSDGNVVIGVDDAHLLDELSATLLHQLAIDRAVHIVATVRSGESVPDAVTSLWKDNHLTRITLSPFSKQQSVELIESVLGGQLEGLSADLMWEASGGNALFLRHLVEGARQAETLRQVNGIWQLRGRAAITSELASLLESRIEQLDDSVLTVLKYLALCEPLDIDILGDLAGDEAVEEAEIAGLVRILRDGRRLNVQYNHPLFGEVIRHRLGLASSRRLRGKLVKALQTRGTDTAAERIRLADLALESDVGVDSGLMSAAARDALAFANAPLGERFARAAVAEGSGFSAAEPLARSLMWQGYASEADAVLDRFRPEDLNEIELIFWGGLRFATIFWAIGDADRADEVLEMLQDKVTDPNLALVVRGFMSACAAFENRIDEAIALSEEVLDSADPSPWAVEFAVLGGGLARAVAGRGDEVAALAARARVAETQTDGLLRFPAGLGEILALTLTGQLDEAATRADRYVRFSNIGQYVGWALAGILVSVVELARGDSASVGRRMEQTLATLDSGNGVAESWNYPAMFYVVQAFSACGRTDDAERALRRAHTKYGRHIAVFGPMLAVAESWQQASAGTVSLAVETAVKAADDARRTAQFAIEAEALHSAARFGDPSGAQRLRELAGMIDGPLAGLYARHASALESRDAVELDLCATEFERLGFRLSAADAAAQASVLHEAEGSRAATVASAAVANRLAAECGGLRTPALVESAQPLPLTTREREIANLVAAGLSNKEIAQRLTVSVRTVEGHIYRACTKLDVADRSEIAALLLKASSGSN
ncbi:LuxR C-terminal-related transcriptional regulator [Gordonia sp. Z-3]|jgi:DNA-binding CsgD family transcriptional regulator|uniref:LuxR C-terminal-related transcriptional regulator n=2 Tax=Gordonia TaxID=2053 RepID=A0A9X3D649_9ACTN|nr:MULTISPECIES: LuxR family transcriptional regulator [Gordonia]MCF3937253.1 LuxR C-terminal-related transcriptional regulator [Gordonia tangerina]MCX2965645.1 LuxR C-terminal-related transcriptional regulator [Gordonia aquimaris]MED5803668.1 LuxR C-terminal-related transcriptional regulator [Gordonia sp. Z-3]